MINPDRIEGVVNGLRYIAARNDSPAVRVDSSFAADLIEEQRDALSVAYEAIREAKMFYASQVGDFEHQAREMWEILDQVPLQTEEERVAEEAEKAGATPISREEFDALPVDRDAEVLDSSDKTA